MPATLQPNITGQRTIIDDRVFLAKAEEYKFMAMVPKGGKPRDLTHSHQLAKRTAGNRRGIPDGTDVENFDQQEKRKLLASNLQWFREAYRVGFLAQEFSDVAGRANLLANEIDYAVDKVMRNMERNSQDSIDQVDDDGVQGSEIRGMGALIDSTFATLTAEWRTPAESIYSGDSLANFQEDDMVAIVSSIFKQRGKRVNLYGMCGIDFIEHVGAWSTYLPDKTSYATVKRFNASDGEYKFTQRIDILEFASARIELHPNAHIFMDRDAEDSDLPSTQGNRSAYLFDWEGIQWKWGLRPIREKLPNHGGGPRGYVHAVGMLCGDPRYHGKVYPNA